MNTETQTEAAALDVCQDLWGAVVALQKVADRFRRVDGELSEDAQRLAYLAADLSAVVDAMANGEVAA